MYIYLTDNIVTEFVPEEDENFPGIPVEERYSQEFVSHLMQMESVEGIRTGYIYDPETQTFSAPPEPELLPEPEPEPEPEPGQPTLTERVAAIETAIEKGLSL